MGLPIKIRAKLASNTVIQTLDDFIEFIASTFDRATTALSDFFARVRFNRLRASVLNRSNRRDVFEEGAALIKDKWDAKRKAYIMALDAVEPKKQRDLAALQAKIK